MAKESTTTKKETAVKKKARELLEAVAKKKAEAEAAAEEAKAAAEAEAAGDPPTDTEKDPTTDADEVVTGPQPPTDEAQQAADGEAGVTSGDLAKHMKAVQDAADEVAETEEALMDETQFCARARISPSAGFHAPSLTIIYAGQTYLLQKNIDLIIKGEAMMGAVANQCVKYGLRREHIIIEEIDPSEIFAGSDENALGVVTLKSSQQGLKPS